MPAHHQRRRPTEEEFRRRRTVAALILVSGVVLIGWAGSKVLGGSGGSRQASTTTTTASTTTTTMPTTTTTDPGTQPQTDQEPPIQGALMDRLQPLWNAIVANDPGTGMPDFFPKSAYVSMKTGRLADPAGDYEGRLVAFYNMDVPSYHAALGSDPAKATLTAVNANPAYAHWVPVGECENGVGYWHLPGVRMVYSTPAGQKSFSVASLISWRGVWYVVHLGPNPRPSNVGTVDQPADGPGTPGPPGGC